MNEKNKKIKNKTDSLKVVVICRRNPKKAKQTRFRRHEVGARWPQRRRDNGGGDAKAFTRSKRLRSSLTEAGRYLRANGMASLIDRLLSWQVSWIRTS